MNERILLALAIPTVHIIHTLDEYFVAGGFISWNTRTSGSHLSPHEFVFLQIVALSLIVTGLILYFRFPRMRWIVSAIASTFVLNGISHSISTYKYDAVSPGLFSGLLLYIPTGLWALSFEMKNTTRRHVLGGAISSVFIHGVVSILSRIV